MAACCSKRSPEVHDFQCVFVLPLGENNTNSDCLFDHRAWLKPSAQAMCNYANVCAPHGLCLCVRAGVAYLGLLNLVFAVLK